ncbi:hypothetical protein E0H75_42175 [Kribbella capetownensis]|uniref:Uncharacterized protein n=1 Tax=Kribbella capetownensis TaxID=1572659 RepID=A0A4R0ILZ1_9ACTN|nr:hypothetical protein [Kribbella capetownensis]TCC33869.1 hypothetical protein E0H75_42175 [Kribbella capetownensis]
MDVAAAALELYGLPPDEFTAARNQVAQQAKDAGDNGSSATLKALRKPTLAAWLANLLVRSDPDGIAELTDLGEQLRQAHVARDGRSLRELTLRRHGLVHKLVIAARTQARAQGHTVSPSTEQRLIETLDAAVIDPGAAQLLRTGQLTSALRHVGFGVVDETGDPAQLTPVKPRVVRSSPRKPPAKPPRKATTRRTAQSAPATAARSRRAELRTRAEQAEREYAAAETERAQAQAELDAHEHQLADLKATIDRLTEELEQARQLLRDASRRTRALQVELNRTTRNATIAQQRRDAGQQRLADLDR